MRNLAALASLAVSLWGSQAAAHAAPGRYPKLRPPWELSAWLGLGGGARVLDGQARGVFDLRLGFDATAAVSRDGNTRLGPFVEAGSATFASVQAVGGVELFVGAAPRPLRMFYYPGEGVFSARLGAGWLLRETDVAGAASTPVATVTFAYGYRAPFSLREYDSETNPHPGERDGSRYMTGVRLWFGATVDLREAAAWQLTAGVEFEPVGGFRYLLGLH